MAEKEEVVLPEVEEIQVRHEVDGLREVRIAEEGEESAGDRVIALGSLDLVQEGRG